MCDHQSVFHFFGHLFIVLAGGIMFFDAVRQMDNGSGTSVSSGWPYGGCSVLKKNQKNETA